MKKEDSKGWIIIRTIAGDKFLCKCNEDMTQVTPNKQVCVTDVREVLTMNLPMGQGMISRRTLLSDIDFNTGVLERMWVTVSSWYKPGKEARELIEAEIKDAEDRKRQAEMMDQLQKALENETDPAKRRELLEQLAGPEPSRIAIPGRDFAIGAGPPPGAR